jgi:hypothetical protein
VLAVNQTVFKNFYDVKRWVIVGNGRAATCALGYSELKYFEQ